MLDYIIRVKDLRSAILDAECCEHRILDLKTTDNIDVFTARSFCDGLLEYSLQFRPEHYTKPFEAFSHAKILSKRHELDRERYAPPRWVEVPYSFRSRLHLIG